MFPYFVMLKSRMSTQKVIKQSLGAQLFYDFSPKSFFLVYLTFAVSVSCLCLFYIKGHASSIRLQWIASPNAYELPSLNERFVYMTYFSHILILALTVEHLYLQRDSPSRPVINVSFFNYIFQNLGWLIRFSFRKSIICCLFTPFSYAILRSYIWRFAALLTSCCRRIAYTKTPPKWPLSLRLLLHSFWMAFIVCLTFQIALLIFRVFLYSGPMIRGKLLSARSNDPNGTLVDGMKTKKKPLTECIATEELWFIAKRDPQRIKSIFQDIDRSVSIWQELYSITESRCKELATSLKILQSTGDFSAATSKKSGLTKKTNIPYSPNSNHEEINSIPLRNKNIFVPPSQGHSPLLEKIKKQGSLPSTTPVNDGGISDIIPKSLYDQVIRFISTFYKAPVFGIFRKTLRRQNEALLPNPWLFCVTVNSLTQLVLKSLKYDTYGVVARDISSILAVYCDTFDVLVSYKRSLVKNHSNSTNLDDDFKNLNSAANALHCGIIDITEKFQDFFTQLNLSPRIERRCWVLFREYKSNS